MKSSLLFTCLFVIGGLSKARKIKFERTVVCTIQEYVIVGLEFDTCQEQAFENFTAHQNPCPMLKKVAEVCAPTVKHCFTEKGWTRGRKLFFDSLAIQYPEMNECGILDSIEKQSELTDKDGEKCSIAEEIAVAQESAACSNNIQSDLINLLKRPMTEGEPKLDLYPYLCKSLQRIKEECVDAKLPRCYEGHDLKAHSAYMLELLKVSGNLIAMHLVNITNVPDCPVFQNSLYLDVTSNSDSSPDAPLVLGLAIALGICLFLAFVAVSVIIARKLRLVPRMRAWMSSVPYEDFVKNETIEETAMEEPRGRRAFPLPDDSAAITTVA